MCSEIKHRKPSLLLNSVKLEGKIHYIQPETTARPCVHAPNPLHNQPLYFILEIVPETQKTELLIN